MAKTIPTSIRFDEQQFDFIKEREKLKKPQEVVNFLLQDYWVRNKLIPAMQQELNSPAFVAQKKEAIDDLINTGVSKVPSPKIIRTAEQWHELKRSCESAQEWLNVKGQIEAAENLSPKQKQIIINTP